MNYTNIPNTELRTAVICLGTGSIGSAIDEHTSFALLDRYTALGGNFIDTAAVYANWLPGESSISEKTIGRWIKSRGNRQEIVLATKGAHPDLATMHISRLAPVDIVGDLDASLRHLQTDIIDLYWLHRDDVSRPVAEILDCLVTQVRAGKIRYYGCSNWTLPRIKAAQAHAAAHALPGFVGNQMLWSLAALDLRRISDTTMVAMDEEMRRFHQETSLAAIPYSAQAQGLFSKMARGAAAAGVGGDARFDLPENAARYRRIQQLQTETSLSITQIVLGYLLSQPFTTIPIVGCRTVEQLGDSMQAADVRMAPEHLAFLKTGEWPT